MDSGNFGIVNKVIEYSSSQEDGVDPVRSTSMSLFEIGRSSSRGLISALEEESMEIFVPNQSQHNLVLRDLIKDTCYSLGVLAVNS